MKLLLLTVCVLPVITLGHGQTSVTTGKTTTHKQPVTTTQLSTKLFTTTQLSQTAKPSEPSTVITKIPDNVKTEPVPTTTTPGSGSNPPVDDYEDEEIEPVRYHPVQLFIQLMGDHKLFAIPEVETAPIDFDDEEIANLSNSFHEAVQLFKNDFSGQCIPTTLSTFSTTSTTTIRTTPATGPTSTVTTTTPRRPVIPRSFCRCLDPTIGVIDATAAFVEAYWNERMYRLVPERQRRLLKECSVIGGFDDAAGCMPKDAPWSLFGKRSESKLTPEEHALVTMIHLPKLVCDELLEQTRSNATSYDINLDAKPELRWAAVAKDFAYVTESGDGFLSEAKRLLDLLKRDSQTKVLLRKANNSLTQETLDELKGISQYTHIDMELLTMLNLLYEIDGEIIPSAAHLGAFAGFGCNSVLFRDSNGHILHGRTFESQRFTAFMKEATIVVNFKRGGKTLYSAVTFPFFVGILTGQRPNQYSISLNSRGGYAPRIMSPSDLMEEMGQAEHPGQLAAFEIRKALEEKEQFVDAADYLSSTWLFAAATMVLGSATSDEGFVMIKSLQRKYYSLTPESFFLGIRESTAIYKHPTIDGGRSGDGSYEKNLQRELSRFTPANITGSALLKVMTKPGVSREDSAIFTVVMSARTPKMLEEKQHFRRHLTLRPPPTPKGPRFPPGFEEFARGGILGPMIGPLGGMN